MATPTSRETFKEYCLRTLGKPVVDINVDDQQVEDRIDDALQYYRDYHFDGTERIIKKIEITQTIKDNIVCLINTNVIIRKKKEKI